MYIDFSTLQGMFVLATSVKTCNIARIFYCKRVCTDSSRRYSNISAMKSLESIPTVQKFLGLIDLELMRCGKDKIIDLFKGRAKEYGNMWVLQPTWNARKSVVLSAPEFFQQYYETEGKYPLRQIDQMERFIIARDEAGIERGIVPSSNETWMKYRKQLNNYYLKPKELEVYIPKLSLIANKTSREIVLSSNCDKDFSIFQQQVYLWALQSIYFVVTHCELDGIDESVLSRLVASARDIIENVAPSKPLLISPKIYFPKGLKKLIKSYQFLREFVTNRVVGELGDENALSKELKNKIRLLDYDQSTSDLNENEQFSNSLDSILGGLDTTQISTIRFWYNLAKNPHVQDKIYEEIQSVMGREEEITPDHLHQFRYLKDCLKESLRLSPPTLSIGRITLKDIVINNTLIPKGTGLIFLTTTHLDEANFKQCDSFIPERWQTREGRHPYAYLPFGIGTRMCVGKRLAEIEMQLITVQLMKKASIIVEQEPTYECETLIYPIGLQLSFPQRNT